MLTHKQVENLCDRVMEERGWQRVHRALINTTDSLLRVYADRLYRNKEMVAFEIKPENTLPEELKMGIGQLACCLPYQVKPYLVLSPQQWEIIGYVVRFLPWLGAVTYEGEDLTIQQKSDRVLEGLIEIKAPEHPPHLLTCGVPLTYEDIMDYLNQKEIHGHYSAKELKAMLKKAYPKYKVSSQNIGRLLRMHQHQPKYKKSDIGYYV